MKVVILAGGLGTRLAEETDARPKPMVDVGGRPLLWHIMKHYAHYGFKEFVVALGYKGEFVKQYFLDYYRLNNSMTIDLSSGQVTRSSRNSEDWTLHLVDTGQDTNTGGRLRRLREQLGDGKRLSLLRRDHTGTSSLDKFRGRPRKRNCPARIGPRTKPVGSNGRLH